MSTPERATETTFESTDTGTLSHKTLRALTARQERRLTNYLEAQFLEMTRGYKKRSEPTTHLPTLPLYLDAARKILAMILQIPPIDPSSSLRTAYLLRLTNDVLVSIPGYLADDSNIPILLDWLDDLDQAWLIILQAQVWDPENGPVDLVIDAEDAASGTRSSPVTQTERTRLRSLLVGGSATLEEWLSGAGRRPERIDEEEEDDYGDPMDRGRSSDSDSESVNDLLENLGVQDRFDELFWRTLQELGLGGSILIPSAEDSIMCEPDVSMK
ncbi:hypothetical protein B0H16DRAFT_1367461 [Mycena metata]|uniref:Uncharacterized protein n=1 Tax=Mycena metata TaxID=1033252 RepID=A0AAD7JKB5_9AGAR|nr:hypothetical protein B0H16DRAFT_1367461 [Mycena metata]